MLMSTGFAMGLSVGLGDLIRFVWGDKWVAAIPAVIRMGLFFPARMLLNVFEPVLQSKGTQHVNRQAPERNRGEGHANAR